jgi:molybdopterin-guanine dinucleotide biosynthesis protein MobB
MTSITPLPVIAFVGKQNSGKTTLLVKLIAELSQRGVRVGTVKHHSHAGFEFDIEGKDSWRHRQAGSVYSVVAAPDQIASVQRIDATEGVELSRIVAHMSCATADAQSKETALDVVLVEGYRRSGVPTIELFRAANPQDTERSIEGKTTIAVVSDISRVMQEAAVFNGGVPHFGFEDSEALADFVQDFIARFSQWASSYAL